MVSAAAFYTAMTAWLAFKGLSNYKLSGVMVLHKLGGMRQFSASFVPDTLPNSTIEEPEVFEKIFGNGNPKGFVLIDIATGQIYSQYALPKPSWRIQLTYIDDKYDKSNTKNNDYEEKMATITDLSPRRYYDQPYVEIGPGAFKYESVTYPPNFLQMHLKKLIKLKEQIEENLKKQQQDILNP